MDWTTALKCFEEISCEPGDDKQLKLLQRELFRAAVRYAHIRADWSFLTLDQRSDTSAERTVAHNAFIESCNALSRYMTANGMPTSWRTRLGTNREVIGDFACFIHCMIGLRSR